MHHRGRGLFAKILRGRRFPEIFPRRGGIPIPFIPYLWLKHGLTMFMYNKLVLFSSYSYSDVLFELLMCWKQLLVIRLIEIDNLTISDGICTSVPLLICPSVLLIPRISVCTSVPLNAHLSLNSAHLSLQMLICPSV